MIVWRGVTFWPVHMANKTFIEGEEFQCIVLPRLWCLESCCDPIESAILSADKGLLFLSVSSWTRPTLLTARCKANQIFFFHHRISLNKYFFCKIFHFFSLYKFIMYCTGAIVHADGQGIFFLCIWREVASCVWGKDWMNIKFNCSYNNLICPNCLACVLEKYSADLVVIWFLIGLRHRNASL